MSGRVTSSESEKSQPRLRLRVKAAAETALRAGHPWVFANSVREQNRPGQMGELAVIFDRQDRFLAAGLFDPDSPIRLRVLHSGKPQAIDEAWWAAQLEQALQRRARVFDEITNGLRWINGESDGFPGLVLDQYGETLALKLYTAAWLPRLAQTKDLIITRLPRERLVLRLSRNIQDAAKQFGRFDGQVLAGPALDGPVIFLESGLRFEADVVRGQKTGFFLDQRENRRTVGSLAKGRDVLNAFSFSGGFSLYAAHGGASSVTDLDLSRHALEAAARNFHLNQSNPEIARCRHQSIQADAFDWFGQKADQWFDLIVLDPPSLAKRESERDGAIRAYEQLAASALTWLKPEGVLVACSCSAHVSKEEFFMAVTKAVGRSARQSAELLRTEHAPDHPATFPEAQYLKGIFLQIGGKISGK
jgi:23S rRNA (cytosine1962-C5)-methyltransferase